MPILWKYDTDLGITITFSEWESLPMWMRADLCECKKCGLPVALFYDKKEKYHIECTGCNKTLAFTASSAEEAKEHWNKSFFSNDKIVRLNNY